ncbi:hypothetical protein T07_144 [Trichinella nelsoni]|uniref:Uncharacterized protein n=1 Tax=Trichinella nelsoni TaxID=6336 RepID=A0A0V0RFS4_9BILA|nr:hypothetical protein T07_144 [Trichinella nelsoni]
MNRAVQQMDDDCTREKGFVKRSTAYRVQHAQVAAFKVYFCPLYILHYSSDLFVVDYNQMCGDFKVLCMLLGQQSGYTKFPCFLCEWDSRARDEHWKKKDWPIQANLTPGSKNICHQSLINPEKVLLPLLHIKPGIMKQFVEALNKNGTCFQYLCTQFPLLSDAKVKEGIFVGRDIQKLIKNKMFSSTMTQVEEAYAEFTNVVSGFLGKKKDPEYGRLVNVMLGKF